MDRGTVRELGLEAGLKLKEQADGSMDFHGYIFKLADLIEARANRKRVIELNRLRGKVTRLETENRQLISELKAISEALKDTD